jgi:hypothetical protein
MFWKMFRHCGKFPFAAKFRISGGSTVPAIAIFR